MSAWVIGGTSGIGRALAAKLSEGGLVLATGKAVDVTSYESLYETGMNFCMDLDETDPLDQIYFCAGDNELEWLGMMGPIGAQNQIGLLEVNAGGFINVMDVLVHLWTADERKTGDMTEARRMSVCAISSDAAERPMRTSIGYCASKAALNMAVRVAARELGPRGWKVFAVAPGMIDGDTEYGSDMTAYIDQRVPEIRKWSEMQTKVYEQNQAIVKKPLRINPMAVAELAYDLVNNHSAHVNGNIFTLNGGR